MQQKDSKKKSSYIIGLYFKNVLIKIVRQAAINKYINHYFILIFSILEILSILIDGLIFQKVEVQQKKLEISILCSIILIDFITVMLLRKDKIKESALKISILIITAGVFETFALDRAKEFRIIAYFILLQICARNISMLKLIAKFLMLIMVVYSQIRYSFNQETNYLQIIEFFCFQFTVMAFSFILYLDDKDIEKGQQFLNIKSKKGQQDDLFLSNRECLREQDNNDINNSQNMSIQINGKKKLNEFDQSYQLAKNNNGFRNTDNQNQYNLNDISLEYVKKNNNNNYNKNTLNTYVQEQDDKKFTNKNKNEQKPIYVNQIQQNISTPDLFSFLNKSLNLISIGIVLLSDEKHVLYRNKTVKKFTNYRYSDNRNVIQQILQISLQMFKSEAQKEIQFQEEKNNLNNQNNKGENKSIKNSSYQKKQYINSILDEQNEKMQKQKKGQKSKLNQQEKYGSVLYNQYETSKGQGEQLVNSLGLRRIATAEVMTTENNSHQPQKIINSNLVQDFGNQIQSNLSNNMNTDYSYQKANSNVSVKNIKSKNFIQVKMYAHNNSKVNKDTTVSPKILSSENIIQDLNATLTGVPLCNVSPSCKQINPKLQTKSIFNQNNLNTLNFINNFENMNSFNKDSVYFQQSELNQIGNPQQLLSKFIQCLIPENIDKLFKKQNLVLDDVIDFLLMHSKCPQQVKFNTDYHLEHYSDEDIFIKENVTRKKSTSQVNQNNAEEGLNSNNKLFKKLKSSQIDEEQEDQKDSQDYDEQSVNQANKNSKQSETSNFNLTNSNEVKPQQEPSPLKPPKQKKAKKKNHQKLYSYFIQNNYLHIHTKLNIASLESSEFENKMTFIEIKLSVLQQEESEKLFVLIEMSDVTQFKKVVDKENLDSYKNKILSSVSHELRTPLNCSIQLLDLLSQNEEISDLTKQAFVNPAMYSNFLMLNIINDILDLAQINYGKFKMTFQQFDLKKIMTECLNLIGLQAIEKHITLELEIDPQIPQLINSDANRIRQVLLNLLNNALKFTQEGIISIKANLVEPNLIQIDVEDTGCGIKKKDLNKILGQFSHHEELEKSTATNSLNGGLGLTIANNLATGLGGNRRIKVRSEYKAGSIFSFCIVNHSLNQKGCTYKQTNLFSKQIINWECFSQYSNMQQTTMHNFQKNKSELLSHLPQNSSSIKHKKHDQKYGEATQSLIRFNTEILHSNLNVNASQNKILNDCYPPPNSNTQRKQSIKKDNTCYDFISATLGTGPNVPSEGGKMNRKFQISLKNTQQVVEQTNSENNNSPKRLFYNNTQGNLTQKQFAENMSDLAKDEEQSLYQHYDSPGKKSETSIKKRFQSDKNSRKTLNYTSTNNIQSAERTAYPSLYDDKAMESASILNKNISDNNQSIKVINKNSENNIRTETEFLNKNINSNFQEYSQKNINTESCDLLQISNLEINEQENKKIPNSFQCQEISQKRTNKGKQNMLSSVYGFDQEDSVIKIKFKEDDGDKNKIKQRFADNGLSQIHEKNSEQIESMQSSYQDLHQKNKHINDERVQKLLGYNPNDKNVKNEFDAFLNRTLELSDTEKNPKNNNPEMLNLPQQVKQQEEIQSPNDIFSINQQQQKIKTEQIVNMNSLTHKKSYPSNCSSKEIKQLQEDVKQQLIKYNQNRPCKCPNILIVDDEGFNLYALELRLKSYGFSVDKAPSGIEALQFVQKKFELPNTCHQKYDIILMDINMPIKNGYQATEDILNYFKTQKVDQPTQISACSAYVQEEMKKQAKDYGMKYYITKPVNQQQLETVLKQAILDNKNQNI